LQAIASKTSGALKIDLNAKMYNTNLNGNTSAMVKTEIQDVEISSVIVPETTVFKKFFIFLPKILYLIF
jgi:hypothetical protein